MDQASKYFLLAEIIEYSKKFQRQRRKMSVTDIHNAMHALCYRPLYSECGVNGDEIVQTGCTDGAQPDCSPLEFSISIATDWVPTVLSADNFRPRKICVENIDSFLVLSQKTKFYVENIVNEVSNEIPKIEPQNESDIVTASWFLGLYFSDTLAAAVDNSVHWIFVRNCIWYLDRAMDAYTKMSNETDFPPHLYAPWTIGLETIMRHPRVVQYESPAQIQLIVKICKQYST
jgi:hypothetical protein